MKKILVSAFAFLGLLFVMSLGNANAAVHHYPPVKGQPDTSFGPYNICLTNAPVKRCLTTHGNGNQMTIQGSGSSWAKLTLIDVFGDYVMQDANGNCVRVAGNGPYPVDITGGACETDGSDPRELWNEEGDNTNGFTYDNTITGGFLGTSNDNDGNNVWATSQGGGNWTKWTLYTP